MINTANIKKNFLKIENVFYLIFIFLVFYIDRYTKSLILKDYNDNIFYINDYLNFDLIWNTGIGFGLFSTNSSIFYNIVTIFIALVIIFLTYAAVNTNKIEKLIYSFIIGGALGNFYDRLAFQAVPDFLDLHVNNFHWFTFNVADIFITFGIIAFILSSYFVKN